MTSSEAARQHAKDIFSMFFDPARASGVEQSYNRIVQKLGIRELEESILDEIILSFEPSFLQPEKPLCVPQVNKFLQRFRPRGYKQNIDRDPGDNNLSFDDISGNMTTSVEIVDGHVKTFRVSEQLYDGAAKAGQIIETTKVDNRDDRGRPTDWSRAYLIEDKNHTVVNQHAITWEVRKGNNGTSIVVRRHSEHNSQDNKLHETGMVVFLEEEFEDAIAYRVRKPVLMNPQADETAFTTQYSHLRAINLLHYVINPHYQDPLYPRAE